MTDNGKEFTDRFTENGEREPTGEHLFDMVCTQLKIDHRLIPPKHPQTNEMVERFNGRISQVVKTTYFANANKMITILNQYLKTYNNPFIKLPKLVVLHDMIAYMIRYPEKFHSV